MQMSALAILLLLANCNFVAFSAQISQQGLVVNSVNSASDLAILPDFVNAIPLPFKSIRPAFARTLKSNDVAASGKSNSNSKRIAFSGGIGNLNATGLNVNLGRPAVRNSSEFSVGIQEFGEFNQQVFTTSRVDIGGSNSLHNVYPFSATGKIFFKIGKDSYVCSGSMIRRGIVLTAAHCVSEFGKRRIYSGIQFVPGFKNGNAPFGTWAASSVHVLRSYFEGNTRFCAYAGIVCTNDVALIQLVPKNKQYAGNYAGWLGYGVDGWGFNANQECLITQLGYPVCLDSGNQMQMTHSQGFVSRPDSNNTLIGSLMCGGSSGGPFIANFGTRPTLSSDITSGIFSTPNVIVGVTSWGYVSSSWKTQGASPLTSENIQVLMKLVCTSSNLRCK